MKTSLNAWLLVIVVVCGLSLWLGRGVTSSWWDRDAGTTETPSAPQAESPPPVPQEPIHLVVLNGTAEAGLARDFGLLLSQTGCVVERIGNAPHQHYDRTLLVNRQLSPERARSLATELGDLPVVLEFDSRSAADAVLVLGADANDLRRQLRPRGASGD